MSTVIIFTGNPRATELFCMRVTVIFFFEEEGEEEESDVVRELLSTHSVCLGM